MITAATPIATPSRLSPVRTRWPRSGAQREARADRRTLTRRSPRAGSPPPRTAPARGRRPSVAQHRARAARARATVGSCGHDDEREAARRAARSSSSSTCWPERGVEVAGRLVGEQQPRAACTIARAIAHALALAARELVGAVVGARREADARRGSASTRARAARRAACPRRPSAARRSPRAVSRGTRWNDLEDEADHVPAHRASARRRRAAAPRGRRARSVPAVGRSRQPSTFSSVDFPEPDGPMIATCSPGAIVLGHVDERVDGLVRRRRSCARVLEPDHPRTGQRRSASATRRARPP